MSLIILSKWKQLVFNVYLKILIFNLNFLTLTDPLKLDLELSYNLNSIKEIEVTDDFLTLDKKIINCQNKETKDDCTTSNYLDTIQRECECIPLKLRLSNKVIYQNSVILHLWSCSDFFVYSRKVSMHFQNKGY